MESTTVVAFGKGSNPKTTLYVGGLDPTVLESNLYSAFIPFGEIRDVSIPLDYASGKHRGFGFVEFEDSEDAGAAIDNMHNAEFFGRVLRVNYAQPMRIKTGLKGPSKQPVWADADTYLEQQQQQQQEQEKEHEETQQDHEETLTEEPNSSVADPMKDLERALG
eukprot:g1207.t1